jgi:CubicO group peptidase (beta-lactamase class C family)
MDFPHREWQAADAPLPTWNLALLQQAMDAIVRFGSIGAMVVQAGRVVAVSGDPAKKDIVRSVRKSLLSALIGIAVWRGPIDLEATLASLGIDDEEPGLTDAEKQATVRDLLRSRSGIYHVALAEPPSMIASRPFRGSALPGTQWFYNNWDFNALGTIYEQATGQSVYAGFLEEIAGPTGMQDFQLDDGVYLRGPQSRHPAYHFRLSTRDMARFGHLFLNGGRWHDRQIIPADWVRESTEPYSRVKDGVGYGYMWWTYGTGLDAWFSAEGAYGQLIAVVPGKQLVLSCLAEGRPREPDEIAEYEKFLQLVMKAAPIGGA